MKRNKERYADIYKDKEAAAQMIRQTDIDTDWSRFPSLQATPLSPASVPCLRPLSLSVRRLRPPCRANPRTPFRFEINNFSIFPRSSTYLPGTQLFLSKFRLIIKIPIAQYSVHIYEPSPSVAEKCALCCWTLIIPGPWTGAAWCTRGDSAHGDRHCTTLV